MIISNVLRALKLPLLDDMPYALRLVRGLRRKTSTLSHLAWYSWSFGGRVNVNSSALTIFLFNKHAKVCCPAYMRGCHQLVAVHWTLPQINHAANTQRTETHDKFPCNSPTIAFSLSVSIKWLDISNVRLSPYSLNLAKLSIWHKFCHKAGAEWDSYVARSLTFFWWQVKTNAL